MLLFYSGADTPTRQHGKGDKLSMNLQHQEPDAKSEDQHYVLRLFVAGATPNSLRAIHNIRLICEEQLPGRHELEVIDIYQHVGQLATGQGGVAPTLVRCPCAGWSGDRKRPRLNS